MKYKINKNLISEQLDGKTIVFDSEKSVLYTLNESASYILKKLKEGRDEKMILSLLIKRYHLSESRVMKDFNELLKDLKKKKIVNSK